MLNEVNTKDYEVVKEYNSESNSKSLNKNNNFTHISKALIILISVIFLVIIFAYFFLVLFNTSSYLSRELINEKDFLQPLSDDRSYRVIRLSNNLDAVLISDPKASKSSASISIGVGSFMDEIQVQGLAHFCEHMLFLGSKSYPKVGEFDDWLVANSGMSNAFTEAERTTFYFEVDNKGFNKTLQMFSRMFAEPLFDINFMNKEIDAVNSEHEKNLNSDQWRKTQLIKSISNPNHPLSKFSTGSKETLRSVSAEKLNEILIGFYKKYYSSHNMKLALVSNMTLDEIQIKTEKYFSDIVNRNKSNKTNTDDKINSNNTGSEYKSINNLYGNLQTNEPPFRKEDLGKIIYYKKVATGSSINFMFNIPAVNQFYKIKPLDYIDYLIKFSGEKSLLNILRKRKLANLITTEFPFSYKTFAMYQISIELTNEGLKDVDLVIRMVFNYLNLIKTRPIANSTYEEIKKISDVNFKFVEKNEDYSSFLASLSTSMFDYDYTHILFGDYIHSIYDEKLIKSFMNCLESENSIILLGSDIDVSNNTFFKGRITKNETWYKTEYIENYIETAYRMNIDQYPVMFNKSENIDPEKSFKLRTVNNFITNSNELLKDCNELKEKCEIDEFDSKKEDLTPTNVNDEANLKIFYTIDKTFKLPKINIFFKILSKGLKQNPIDYLNLKFLCNYLEYNLSILLAESIETGNVINIEMSDQGINVVLNCFTDVAEKIVNIIINEIFKFNPDSVIFDEIIEITTQKLKENKNEKPYAKNSRMYFNKIMKYNVAMYTEMLDLFSIDNIAKKDNSTNPNPNNKPTYQNFLNSYESFKNDLLMTIFFYGNVDKDDMDKMITLVKSYIKKPNSTTNISKDQNPVFQIQNSIHLHRRLDDVVTYQIKNDAENEVNHAVTSFYQVGPRDEKKALYLSAMDKCLGNVFYYNLRTVQQLGYIVAAGYSTIDSIMYYRIIVQGSKKNPSEIEKAINDVIYLAQDKLKKCEGEKFEEIREAIKDQLKKKDDNLKERSGKIWREISENTYEFNRSKELIKTLTTIDHTTLLKFFNNLFFDNPARLSVHNYSPVKFDGFKNEPMVYELNKNYEVTYTQDLNVFLKKDFIYAFKYKKFRNFIGLRKNNKNFNSAKLNKSSKSKNRKQNNHNKN